MFINGILLIYHHPPDDNAPTILDHVKSFQRYSQYPVWEVNTCYGFPPSIYDIKFTLIVLHYSLFGSYPFSLPDKSVNYIEKSSYSAKIAFFQDEYRYCDKRYRLIDRLKIDIIYTLLDEKYFDLVYRSRTSVKYVLPTLAGYVPEGLATRLPQFVKPFSKREIDVGYRARQLPYFMGQGGQDKTDIAAGFLKHSLGHDMVVDISIDENKRIYGNDWFRFIGNCKFMLGVEAGVSIFDIDGTLEFRCNQFLKQNPSASFDDLFNVILKDVDGNVNYRTISPRIFESAALQTVPLLFKGYYNGIIIPGVNYIAIEKDFSNFDRVISQMNDRALVQDIICNNLDLISRHELTYQGFISGFDNDVQTILKIYPIVIPPSESSKADMLINRGFALRRILALARYKNFPGRNNIKVFYYCFINQLKVFNKILSKRSLSKRFVTIRK